MNGYDQMPHIVARAYGDLKSHLWSLYWISRMVKAESIIELGVRTGDSTRALLAAVNDLGNCWMTSIDKAGDVDDVRNITKCYGVRLDWREWEFEQNDSVEAANDNGPMDISLLFVDTDHSYETTKREIAAWHTKVSEVMIFHDTGNHDETRDGVLPAILDFMKTHGDEWTFENHPHVSWNDCGLGILWRKK